ncbi:MAG: DUF362 domain-containing protein [Candidatus Thorarchaeota archaeon]
MNYTSEVAIATRRTPQESLSEALSKLLASPTPKGPIDRVIIKPSIYNPRFAGNTSSSLVGALIRLFKSIAPVLIVESDNPLRNAEDAFQQSSYHALEGKTTTLVNLSKSELIPVKMAGHLFESKPMPTLLTGSRMLINAATIKVDPGISVIGASMKNLFGLLPEVDKSVYHKRIDEALVDLLHAFRPDLTVVDLTEIAIGRREDGRIAKVGGVVVGTDPVAVDAFCCDLVGIDPFNVPYIVKAHELGLGEALIDRIKIRGTEYQKQRIYDILKDQLPPRK